MKEGTLGQHSIIVGSQQGRASEKHNVRKADSDRQDDCWRYNVYLKLPLTESPSSNESEEETDTMIGNVILLRSRMIPTPHG